MKKLIVITLCLVAAVLSGAAYVHAQDAPKPEKGVLVGECIALANYAMRGDRGEDAAEPGKYQAEQGFPVGIIEEETGDVFIAVWRNSAPASHLETANKAFAELMGKKVAVQGLIYRQKGLNLIRASLISEY